MLRELPVVEQRYLAVREVLDTGASIVEVARQYGVDRRTLHRWISRYVNGGLEALVTQSSRPDRSPNQMAPVIEARLVALRRVHSGWGPRTLKTKLTNEFGDRAPSRAAIYRALVRHQLITPTPRRRPPSSYKRWGLWSSMPVTHLISVPSLRNIRPTTSICHSSIERLRSQRL